ncbi:MAG: TolC family protein [Candidatus Omnitrophota bacterium]
MGAFWRAFGFSNYGGVFSFVDIDLSMKKILSTIIFIFFIITQAGAEDFLTWGDCLKEAAKNNPTLISAQENIKQYEAAKRVTASTLYPQLSGDVTASTAKNSSSSGGVTTSSTGDSYGYGLSGTQLIFDGLETLNNVNAAKQNIAASTGGYQFTSSQVRMDLRTAFAGLLKAQEMISVTEDIVKIRRDDFQLITLRYESGLEHKGALLTAEADLAQANLQVSEAKRNLELTQRQLTKALGRKIFSPLYVKGSFEISDSVKEKPDFETIADKNPSLKQLIAKKNSALFSIRSAYGSFFPELTAQAGADKSDTKWTPDGSNWNLGLTLSLPILEGGLRMAQVSQAKAVYNQAVENERAGRDAIIVTLDQTWAIFQDAQEAVDVRHKILVANEERAKIADAQYAIGFISFDNWIIIRNDLVNSKLLYLTAQADALTSEAKWIQAKGETLEYAQ